MFLDKARLVIFGQICSLNKSNPIVSVARRQLALKDCFSNSWFIQLRKVTNKYEMEDPAIIRQDPPSKYEWTQYCKKKVNLYWTIYFQNECKKRKSLEYFNPEGCLSSTHILFTLAAWVIPTRPVKPLSKRKW